MTDVRQVQALADLADRADRTANALADLADAVEANPSTAKLAPDARTAAQHADTLAGKLHRHYDRTFPPRTEDAAR